LADLAFVGLTPYLKEKMDGQEFVNVNWVLQRALAHENRARHGRSHSRFKGDNTREKERHNVSYIEGEGESEDDNEVCVAEWVDTPKDKLISCSFLKPGVRRKDEMKYMFDMSKCDKLFDLLVRGGVIKLIEGHVIPSAEMLAKKKYYKWHDSYSHKTNKCNHFRR
jgi:hypothetical protein